MVLTENDTFIQRIRHWASVQPTKTALIYCNDKGEEVASYTYEQLNLITYSISQSLVNNLHLSVGECVMLVYPPCVDFILIFISCIRAGIVPVPLYPPYPTGARKNIYLFSGIQKNCNASSVLCNGEYMKIKKAADVKNLFSLAGNEWPNMTWHVTDSLLRNMDFSAVPEDEPALHFPRSSLCFLQYTSGSTSFPKGVMISIENLTSNMAIIIRSLHAGPSTRVVSWLPQYHDMGLIGSNLSLPSSHCGGTGVYMSPMTFISDPCLWLRLISRYKGTHIQAPNFAFALLSRRLQSCPYKQEMDLSSLQHIFDAAEPIDVTVVAKFLEITKPMKLHPRSFIGGFGLAESSVYVCDDGHEILSIRRDQFEMEGKVECVKSEDIRTNERTIFAPSMDSDMHLFSCGDVTKNPEIHIRIMKGTQLAGDDEVGVIVVQSPSVAMGYYPDRTESFSLHFPETRGNWLNTGDLGFIHNNQLFVCGRKKDLIILRGRNFYPQDLEACCSRLPLVKPGSVVAAGVSSNHEEGLLMLLETRQILDDSRYSELAGEVRRVIAEEAGVSPSKVVFLAAKSILKTTSGKVCRGKNKDAYLKGQLKVVYEEEFHEGVSSTESPSTLPSQKDHLPTCALHGEELVSALLEDVCYLAGVQSYTVQLSDSLEMIGLDSLKRAQLGGALEQYYGVSVDSRVLFDVSTTFEQLVQVVDSVQHREPIVRDVSFEGGVQEDLHQPLMQQNYEPPKRSCLEKYCCLIR